MPTMHELDPTRPRTAVYNTHQNTERKDRKHDRAPLPIMLAWALHMFLL